MYQHLFKAIVVVATLLLSACAERVIDIHDKEGKLVGGCNAGFDWHFYGLQDSIDYLLYECAKESIAKGYTISDKRLLTIDFTLPTSPPGQQWNKKLAMQQFHQQKMSERKLGYVLAAIEYDYMKIVRAAEEDLSKGHIDKAEFDDIVAKAKFNWLGE